MGSDQDIPGTNYFEGVGGSRFCYVREDHIPTHNISLEITDEHIIAGAKRPIKPPARFIEGERDIPQSDAWKLRKRPRQSANAQDEEKKGETISVMVPPLNLDYDSGGSPLTELEDLSDEMDDSVSDSPSNDADVAAEKFPEHSKPNSTHDRGGRQLTQEDRRGGCAKCAGKMINLRNQAQQALLCRSHETVSLRKENETLQRQNNRLRAELANVRASQDASTADPTTIRSSADELFDQRNEIHRLRRRLSSAVEFVELTRPPPSCNDAFVLSTGFIYKEMYTLSNYVVYTANALCKIRRHHVNDETISQDLTLLIKQTMISKDLFSTDALSAFRALTFGFIQKRVFHSPEIWRDLHFDSVMLRQYQSILEQSISPESLERYHRAAVYLTLTKNPEFKEVFVPGYTKQIQFEFFDIMAPLLHSEDVSDHVKHETWTLFRHAITLRASCYPHKRTRYQLVQFKPGHVYDPQTMRAEDEVGAIVTVPEDGQQRHIKVCVHGIMKAYSVRESADGLGLIKELSQPFLLGDDTQGHIISEKAAVILE
ncbi:hypothetical protein IFM58399_09797 [Aspergillus lentulus]|uniref:BZIP domain-containing protein n=1 Tax=Aspergillus lentulus TaxID=293939 RepID=A0ABQ1B314_ASPLE|nr:uncharacterized protein IFM58399_09797 [Aspergillus lentulus]KAF4171824.1 hypothetical protein CNMCM8060_002351 [Aspergillus lentulus]KAF4178205.1 hypothetical protein CNMCM7927_002701 [Aspergillus lentulus]KAF4188511.1 hypothetical protein CNMCM8694_004664 [Aspergillus lentulus]GFF54328.1 hypothetical protein IFM58399_09797 [Aspergillus lentulus]GFF79128.1 hypothetical protein IFM62136_09986 [Aspergillus lentulus]